MTFEGVLDEIHGECESVDQWAKRGSYGRAAEHKQRADALLNLIEVHLTGNSGASYGGWGLQHTEGGIPARNGKPLHEHDIRARLVVLLRELKWRKLIDPQFRPNCTTQLK